MFNNECLTGNEFEATTSAIVMAGIILSFLVDYLGHRFTKSYATSARTPANEDLVNVLVLEAGIIFHSLCKCCYTFDSLTRFDQTVLTFFK